MSSKLDYLTSTTADVIKHYGDNAVKNVKVVGSNTGKASTILRRELKTSGVTEPLFSNAAHHIIPVGPNIKNPDVGALQKILSDCGVDINSAANGVFLPTKAGLEGAGAAVIHRGPQNKEYVAALLDTFRKAKPQSSTDVAEVLNKIRKNCWMEH